MAKLRSNSEPDRKCSVLGGQELFWNFSSADLLIPLSLGYICWFAEPGGPELSILVCGGLVHIIFPGRSSSTSPARAYQSGACDAEASVSFLGLFLVLMESESENCLTN